MSFKGMLIKLEAFISHFPIFFVGTDRLFLICVEVAKGAYSDEHLMNQKANKLLFAII